MSYSDSIYRLDHWSEEGTRLISGLGSIFLAGLMMVTVVDVTLRFFLNFPILGSIEISGVLLLLTIFCGIPYAAAKERHIRVDFLITLLSERLQFWLDSLMKLVGLILFIILTWRSLEYSWLMEKLNRTTGILELPISPIVLVVTFGWSLISLVTLIKLSIKLKENLTDWKQILVWIILGAAITFALYSMAVLTRDLPFHLSPFYVGLLGMAFLFIVFLCGLPVMGSLILVGFMGVVYLRGIPAGYSIMGSVPFDIGSNYTYSVIPLFVLMGEFCFHSGLGTELYQMAYRWIGQIRGGISMGTVVACGGFAAVCGDSMATAVTMGTIALPEMKKFNYSDRLAVGCVAAGGTLGVLIPPSLAFILYALLADQSIATLFIAGILPGILLVTLFMATIYLLTWINPEFGPAGPRTTLKEKVKSLRGVWAIIALFVLVIGGMYAGVFTPTEGGGIGAFGAMMIGIIRRRLSLKGIWASLIDAAMISTVCIGILIGAYIFGSFLAASKLPMELANYVAALAVPNLIILILILISYLFLGCMMPAIPMLVLTVPIFFPVINAMGYDPIWFGVIMVLMFEMAVITPPMGINILALQTIAEGVPLARMFRGVMPFLVAMIVCVALLIAFPQIALVIPNILG